jgi:hypothetical protein
MNASKENATIAIAHLEKLCIQWGEGPDRQFVREFLEAAHRKLPSEASYAKEKTRRKTK